MDSVGTMHQAAAAGASDNPCTPGGGRDSGEIGACALQEMRLRCAHGTCTGNRIKASAGQPEDAQRDDGLAPLDGETLAGRSRHSSRGRGREECRSLPLERSRGLDPESPGGQVEPSACRRLVPLRPVRCRTLRPMLDDGEDTASASGFAGCGGAPVRQKDSLLLLLGRGWGYKFHPCLEPWPADRPGAKEATSAHPAVHRGRV